MSEWVIISLGMLLLGGLIVSGFCFPRFYREVVFEKWGAGIASFMGKLVIAGISLWGANYYYHNVFIFNQDRAKEFQQISQNFAELRLNVNKLSALVKMREYGELESMSKNDFKKEVMATVNSIANYEIKSSNTSETEYYFGKKVLRESHDFIYWTNYVTIQILKKQYFPPDKITDDFYHSIIYSMQNQLYTSSKSIMSNKIPYIKIIMQKNKKNLKYSLADKILAYKQIITMQQLANNI